MDFIASTTRETTPTMQRSTSFPFQKLPPELRDMVYKHLFDGTRLTFGYREIQYQFRKVLPSRNALAILRVCKSIKEEIDDLWIFRVLFNFEDGMTLLDKLSLLPRPTLECIRHVRTRMLSHEPEAPDGIEQNLVHDLHLLPGLNLDRLQIVSPWGFGDLKSSACNDIQRFLTPSFPCKELCLITPGSPFHESDTWTSGEVSRGFSAKIKSWATALDKAGDDALQLTIAVVQSTEMKSNRTGTVHNDSARQVFEETAVSLDAIQSKVVEFGQTLQLTAETLVIFKKVPPTSANPDEMMTGMDEETVLEIPDSDTETDTDEPRTWLGDIRDEFLLDRENDDLENMTTGDLFPWPHEIKPAYVIIDKYNDIDDIIWPGKNTHQAWNGILN